jgi:poly(A) polymerase
MISYPKNLLEYIRQFASPGLPVYLVGGAVRDQVMRLQSRDLDFVVQKDAISLGRKVADVSNGAFYVLDAERGSARVLVNVDDENLTLDFANFRGDNLEGDLSQRDFSVNALALDLNDPEKIIDPLNGRDDIESKIIRVCSIATFKDDPVRILRAVRFSFQLGFRIDSTTERELRSSVSLLANSTIERLRDELFYILGGSKPSLSIAILENFGILPYLLPELVPLVHFSQSSHHAHDTWEHTLTVLDYCEQILDSFLQQGKKEIENCFLRSAAKELQPFKSNLKRNFIEPINSLRSFRSIFIFAALYHDVGKPATRSEDDNGIHFVNHEIVGAEMARDRARTLALSNEEIQFIKTIIHNHMRIHPLAKAEKLDFRKAAYHYFLAAGRAGVADCLFSLADLLSTYEDRMDPSRWEAGKKMCTFLLDAWFNHYPEWIKPPLLINGDEMQSKFHLEPGPLIGRLLAKLEEAQASGNVKSLTEAHIFIKSILSGTQEEVDRHGEIIL